MVPSAGQSFSADGQLTWADWDEELLGLKLQEIKAADFDLSLTGFNPGEIDNLLALDTSRST